MDPKTRAIAFGVIALVVLAAIIGSIIYLGKTSQNRTNTRSNSLANLPVVSAQPSPGATSSNTGNSNGFKTYVGKGFSLKYPASWGLLTCSNTENVEFDPTNSQDLQGVVCETAVKPITVMVGSNAGCSGSAVNLGNYQVDKSSGALRSGGIQNRWCATVGGKVLNITNRVSDQGNQATSPNDYSSQVEEMIKSLTTTPSAS